MKTTQPLKYTLVATTTALLMLSMTVLAAPLAPGDTLDPTCNPGDRVIDGDIQDCYVDISDTDWTQDINGVWNNTDNIGIGTDTPQVGIDFNADDFNIATTNFNVQQIGGAYGVGELGGVGLATISTSLFGGVPLGENDKMLFLAKTTGPLNNQTAALQLWDDGDRGAEANFYVVEGNRQPGFAAHPDSADFYFFEYDIGGSGDMADVVSIYVQEDNINGFVAYNKIDGSNWDQTDFRIDEDGFQFNTGVSKVAGTTVSTESSVVFNANGIVFPSIAVEPIGENGAMYYNTSTNKMRVYENGAWVDLI